MIILPYVALLLYYILLLFVIDRKKELSPFLGIFNEYRYTMLFFLRYGVRLVGRYYIYIGFVVFLLLLMAICGVRQSRCVCWSAMA